MVNGEKFKGLCERDRRCKWEEGGSWVSLAIRWGAMNRELPGSLHMKHVSTLYNLLSATDMTDGWKRTK